VLANGPRFNSRAEIRAFLRAGGSAISQTAGPEIVLSGELEIPYILLGFGVDYANGVVDSPTSVEELTANMEQSKTVLTKVILEFLGETGNDSKELYNGFVYRF